MKLLIGSRALHHWNPNMTLKPTADWDVISYEEIEGTEWHHPDHLNNADFERYATPETVEFNGHVLNVVHPKGLAIIKRSHLWRDLGFQKHITHYHKFLHNWHNYDVCDQEILQHRIDLTTKTYPQGHPKLNKTVADFFDDAVTKKYDHDWLHKLVAFYDEPLYNRLQRNKSLAWCDKDLWETLSLEDKTKCVAEETYVIAIERFMVPKNWNYPSRLAFIKALDKVCTTLCSGWFRDHAIDFYPEVCELYNDNKFFDVKRKIENE